MRGGNGGVALWPGGGDSNVRLGALAERIRGSLFFVPMLFVFGGVVLGLLSIRLDEAIGAGRTDLPLGLASTVESARTVVTTVAGATITVAGIAFSIALLVIQQSAARYSPRAVQGIFRDAFNKRVMGFVVGTFTFCLVVMRAIRSAIGEGQPVVPNVSVGLAVVLGIGSILAILAFINHSAHRLEVSTLIEVAASEAVSEVRATWRAREDAAAGDDRRHDTCPQPTDGALVVRFEKSGWVQRFDASALRSLAPPAGVVRLEVGTGDFASSGTRLCTIWPPPRDRADACTRARRAVQLGRERTVAQDARYGIQQLADIAQRGLSPGINDPATAQEAIHYIGVVVIEMLQREPPAGTDEDDDAGRRLAVPTQRADELLALAFDDLRIAAAPHPSVCVSLIHVLADVEDALEQAGVRRYASLLRECAARVVAANLRADLLPVDQARVSAAFAERFPSGQR